MTLFFPILLIHVRIWKLISVGAHVIVLIQWLLGYATDELECWATCCDITCWWKFSVIGNDNFFLCGMQITYFLPREVLRVLLRRWSLKCFKYTVNDQLLAKLEKNCITVFMKWIRKWFTLVEVLISLVIVSLLVIVIFQTYKSIADISVRVDNIYKMTNEMLFAHQTIQNLVDVWQLDIDKRFDSTTPWNIDQTNWKTDTIYFKWVDWYNVKVLYDKECTIGNTQKKAGCLKLAKWLPSDLEPVNTDTDKVVELTNPQIVIIDTWFTFVVQPIDNIQKPDTANTNWSFFVWSVWYNDKADILHPGFWMYGKMRININSNRPKLFQVETPIQSFFNIRSY